MAPDEIHILTGRDLDTTVSLALAPSRQVRANDTGEMVTVYDGGMFCPEQFQDNSHSANGLRRWAAPLCFSTDVGLAWRLVERLSGDHNYTVKGRNERIMVEFYGDGVTWLATGDTAAEAICRAFLLATATHADVPPPGPPGSIAASPGQG